jgi:Na+/H+ antiporter
MISALSLGLALAFSVAILSVLSRRLAVQSSVLMLIVGGLVSFIPGLKAVALEPDLVLLVLLPPLLYSSGVGMSWRGFRSNLRPILLLAIGCVLFTAAAVAAVSHYLLGLPWAVGFVLGAIVSPPDAIAPMAIMRKLGLPQRLLTVLEGESLVNDATALVAFSFALGAVSSGQFSPASAAAQFAAIVGGEIAYGIAVGFAMLWLRHLMNEPRAEVLLALTTPFIAFWPPHELGASGVVACVAAGLTVSWNGRRLIRSATRLQGYFIWDLMTWSVESLVFLLTGLQANAVASAILKTGFSSVVASAALVCATVIIVRFVWVFPATYLPRLSPAIRRRDPHPDWRTTFMVGYAGLRGAVSLTAALSIPLTVSDAPFPSRDLILFITFCVIAVTMIGQGAVEAKARKHEEQIARLEGMDAALAALENCDVDTAPAHVNALRRAHSDRRVQLASSADELTTEDPVKDAVELQLRLLTAERSAIDTAYEANRLSDEARRRIEREFDLEEARALHALTSAASSDRTALE